MTADRGRESVSAAARLALAHWAHVLADGLAAVRDLPGLMAQVDQHAAEIRDTLTDRTGRLPLLHLAAYADGVADTAKGRGWDLAEAGRGDWARASWPLLRLLAVCSLAPAAS